VNVLIHFQLEALGQCIPPPRHVLPVSRYESGVTLSKYSNADEWKAALSMIHGKVPCRL